MRDFLKSRGLFGLSLVPFVVNSAFSIELYIKTQYAIQGEKAHGQPFATPIAGPDDFRGYVEQLNDAYVDWRYSHESGQAGAVQIWPMILVMKALDVTCRARGGFTSAAESNAQPS